MRNIHYTRKFFLYLLLILSFVAISPVSAMDYLQQDQPVADADQDSTIATNQIFLPVGMNQYYSSTHVWQSPFSISIAALHEINAAADTPTEAGAINAPYPSLLDALLDSGATGTRVEVKWAEVQPTAGGAYNWSWYDQTLGTVGRSGMQMLVSIEAANAWAVDDPAKPCRPIKADKMGDFTAFLSALVTRYKEHPYNVRFWEIDNEPDSTVDWGANIGQGCWGKDGDRYAQMLAQAYQTIKTVDPLATVVMGGLAYDSFLEYGGNFERYFADDVMTAGGGSTFDVHNLHYFTDFRAEWERWNSQTPTCGIVGDDQGQTYYAGGVDIIAKTNHYKNRMLTCHGVDKPLWFTEIAASSGRPVNGLPANRDIDWQARYVPQVYTRALSAGVGNITWYGLTTPNQDDEQGLLYHNLTPKPSYFAYQTMTSQLNGFEYHHTISVPGIEGYVFRNGLGVEKHVLWGENANYTLSPATQVRIVDYLGNESVVMDGAEADMDHSQNGAVVLLISQNPVYVTVINR